MKLYYGKTPINSLNIKHYEISTSDANVLPSDVQSGRTYYAKGKKGIGTGKSFEFAFYGGMETNDPWPIPSTINVVQVTSVQYPIQQSVELNNMINIDFTSEQTIGSVIIDDVSYPIKVTASNNLITVICDKSITFQVFYGKDNYR